MNPYLGEIRLFAGPVAPAGWALCDGTLLPIQNNEPLYSLLGATYGGDGNTNFGLPDLRGRIPLGTGTSPSGTPYPLGKMDGAEQINLELSQLPTHTHSIFATTANATSANPGNAFFATTDESSVFYVKPGIALIATDTLLNTTVTEAGSGDAHENRMPISCINYIIALTGDYPSHQ